MNKKEIIKEYMSNLAKKRHKNKTKEERSEHGKKMVQARWGKKLSTVDTCDK